MQNFPFLGFTGAFQDPVLKGYPLGNGYRWYLPALMRFNAADSFSPFGAGGVNPYIYVGADPVNHSDPTGHINVEVAPVVTKLVDDVVEQEERDAAIAAAQARRTATQATESGPSTSRGETGSSQAPSPRRRRSSSSSSGGSFGDRPMELHLDLNPLESDSLLPMPHRGREIGQALQDFHQQLADLEETGDRIWRDPVHLPLRHQLPRTELLPNVQPPMEVLTLNGNAARVRAGLEQFITSLTVHRDVFSQELAEAQDIRDRLLTIEMRSTGAYWRNTFTPN